MSNEAKANERDSKEITLAFDALTARLDSLDVKYAWNDPCVNSIEIDMVREALEKAGYGPILTLRKPRKNHGEPN
jgi:hypothetical protein